MFAIFLSIFFRNDFDVTDEVRVTRRYVWMAWHAPRANLSSGVTCDSDEFRCDFLRGEDEVDAAACDGAFGHIRLCGCVRPLRDGDAANFPDAAESVCPIEIGRAHV